MTILKALHRFFRSIILAVVLLVIIAALSALSTLVPQGREVQFYLENYSPLLVGLILGIHFHNFFRSFLFLFPSGVLFINLAVCTIDRIVRQNKSGIPKRFGPDLIHIGILLLMIGGLISLLGKREGYIYLTKGEYAELPGGYQLFLTSLKYITYPDGRPKEYVSSVEIRRDEEKVTSHEIRVNKPLKIGGIKVFQDSYSSTSTIILRDKEDKNYSLSPGEGFRVSDRLYLYRGVESQPRIPTIGEAEKPSSDAYLKSMFVIFEEFEEDGKPVQTFRLAVSDQIDVYRIEEIITTDQTGLRVVQDKGFIPALIAFCIIGIGLVLTFVQKLGEKNL